MPAEPVDGDDVLPRDLLRRGPRARSSSTSRATPSEKLVFDFDPRALRRAADRRRPARAPALRTSSCGRSSTRSTTRLGVCSTPPCARPSGRAPRAAAPEAPLHLRRGGLVLAVIATRPSASATAARSRSRPGRRARARPSRRLGRAEEAVDGDLGAPRRRRRRGSAARAARSSGRRGGTSARRARAPAGGSR